MLPNCFKSEISCHSSKLYAKKQMKKQYLMSSKTNNANKPWKISIHNTPDWPRQEAVAKLRLQTGQDILAKHLSRFRMLQTPTCKLCNLDEDMDRDHLMRCPALRSRLHPRPENIAMQNLDDESYGQLTALLKFNAIREIKWFSVRLRVQWKSTWWAPRFAF